MSLTPIRLASAPWDYRRLGIVPEHVTARENRTHLDGLPGSMEWWFIEAATPDGNASIGITSDPNFDGTPGLVPASLGIVAPTGSQPLMRQMVCKPDELHSLAEEAGVALRGNYYRADGTDSYHGHFEDDGLSIDIELTPSVPAWRPETGHFIFGDHDEGYLGWIIPTPIAESHLVVHGRGVDIDSTGVGYIDRGWTNRAMSEVVNNWIWYHWQFGEYTVAAIDITFEKEFGYPEFPLFMVYRDGRLLAGGPGTQNRDHITVSRDRVHDDPAIGRQIVDAFTVVYQDHDDQFELTVGNTDQTELLDLFDEPGDSPEPAAGTITKRMTGPASFTHRHRGEVIAQTSLEAGVAVCEQMFAGPPRA